MENASKALIIAGGLLIALLVISLLVIMFSNLSNYQNEQDKVQSEQQISDFNNAYTTFNRQNVRGSDLYSLLNKAIDYNKRETAIGSSGIEYKSMTIVVNFVNLKQRETMTKDNKIRIFKENTYTVAGGENTFKSFVNKEIETIETIYGGAEVLNKIVAGMDKIFIDKNSSEQKKEEAYKAFNKLSKIQVASFKELDTKYEDICKYYEFVYFKRGIFDCTTCEYDQKTGRVIKMEFKFTGKFK